MAASVAFTLVRGRRSCAHKRMNYTETRSVVRSCIASMPCATDWRESRLQGESARRWRHCRHDKQQHEEANRPREGCMLLSRHLRFRSGAARPCFTGTATASARGTDCLGLHAARSAVAAAVKGLSSTPKTTELKLAGVRGSHRYPCLPVRVLSLTLESGFGARAAGSGDGWQ